MTFDANQVTRILLLEDSVIDAERIHEQLANLPFQTILTRTSTRAEYEAGLTGGAFDIILCDFSLPDLDGMLALELAAERAPEIPFIFVSGVLGEDVALEAFRKGATDYVLKPHLIRLPAIVERALKGVREKLERQRVERQKDILVQELSHRVKNNLAIITSIIRRTARGSADVEEFQSKLLARIQAMADAHALLFEGNWNETELLSIFSRAVDPYDSALRRFNLGRTDLVKLQPKSALAFSMIFNELVTNAAKYGALSNDLGRVDIGWQRPADNDDLVTVVWKETGGPAVIEPNHQGFGSTLLKATVEYELRGKIALSYAQAGLACEIRFPLDS